MRVAVQVDHGRSGTFGVRAIGANGAPNRTSVHAAKPGPGRLLGRFEATRPGAQAACSEGRNGFAASSCKVWFRGLAIPGRGRSARKRTPSPQESQGQTAEATGIMRVMQCMIDSAEKLEL